MPKQSKKKMKETAAKQPIGQPIPEPEQSENINSHKKILLQNDIQSKKKPTDMILTGLGMTPDGRGKNK